jgi:hypothetical protein
VKTILSGLCWFHSGSLGGLSRGRKPGALWLFCLLILNSLTTVKAAELQQARVSQIVRQVTLLPEQTAPRPAQINDEIRNGTAVRTGTESRAELEFTDQTLARLGANTIFSFKQGTRNLDLGSGAMLLRVPKNAGGAQIKTSVLTAAITGTTILLEFHPDAYCKFIVMEGTGRIFRNDRVGESVLVHAGEMLIANPRSMQLPDPVHVDLKRLMKTSNLVKGFRPLASAGLIDHEITVQADQKSRGSLLDTNLVIFGGGTAVTLTQGTDVVDQRFAALDRSGGVAASHSPTPPPESPTPTISPPATITPTVTPTPSVTVSPTASPSPTSTPTSTPSPTATPTITPTATPIIASSYNGGTGNWSNPGSWNPSVVPNNGNNGAVYDVTFSTGKLTQDIVSGVIINQLFMSGGTLVLANPLTLEVGLQFTGGSILSGALNIAGVSSQTAVMGIGNTIINNSGSYDLALINGPAFSGQSGVFNNSGTLTLRSTDGTLSFNISLINSGTVSAGAGTVSLTGGGTSVGLISVASGSTLQFGSNFVFGDGAEFGGSGLTQFNDGTTTSLSGKITNNANILLNSTGDFTDLVLTGNVTLSGTGTLTLQNADRILGTGTFTNAGNIIRGETGASGSFGNDQIGIVNLAGGLIDANVPGLTLNLDPANSPGLTNQGVMQASNGGILFLNGAGGGAFANSGTIQALSGGSIEITGRLTSSGTLDLGENSLSIRGGSYTQTAGTFRLAGGTVTTTPALSTAPLDFEGGLVDAWGSIVSDLTNNATFQPTLGGTGLAVTGRVDLFTDSKLTFLIGGLAQGSQYGYLNVNGTLALDGQLVVSFANGFQNSITNEDSFTVANSSTLTGTFTNVLPGGRLMTSDGFGSFQVDYDTDIVLSNFIPNGVFLNFAGLNSTTGAGGNGQSLTFSLPAITFGPTSGEFHGASFSGGNAAFGSNFLGGNGGSLSATAITGDVIVNSAIDASSGANGKDVTGGTGGSVSLTSNSGQIAVNNTIQVSHDSTNRRSAAGGTISLKSGKSTGLAINVSNTGQLLSLLDAAAPGPGGKIIIQAVASQGDSQINLSGKLEADRGTIDVRHSSSSGQINLTNADLRADTIKVAALGSNGVLRIGGGALSADTTLQLYAPNGNGQVVFVGNVSLNGNSIKSIAGDSVTINNGVLVTVHGPKASVYVNSTGSIPNANYTGFGGNGHTTGSFGGSGANPPQPLANAPGLGTPPGG